MSKTYIHSYDWFLTSKKIGDRPYLFPPAEGGILVYIYIFIYICIIYIFLKILILSKMILI